MNKRKKSLSVRRGAKPAAKVSSLDSVDIGIKSILVPTDFSQESFQALDYALVLAQVFSAKITLAHVIVPITTVDSAYGIVGWNDSDAEENAKLALDKIRRERSSSTQVDMVVKTGHPYRDLDRIAKEVASDLIVIATHGRTGFKHMILGSVAEHVVRYAPCPVLVIRDKERDFISAPKARGK